MPAAWDTPAALAGLAQLVRTIPGQLLVTVGAPESLTSNVQAYLQVGPSEIMARSTEVYRAATDLIVTFGYAVAGAEQTAEEALADALNELDRRVLQNRKGSVTGNTLTVTAMLDGSVESMDPPAPVAGFPDFALFAGQEVRLYPRVVRVYQEETI